MILQVLDILRKTCYNSYRGGISVQCGNVFCIYWFENGCCLDEIALDRQGSCESCIYVEIEQDVLESKRMDMKAKIHKTKREDAP